LFVINLKPHAAVLPAPRFNKKGWLKRHEEILRDIKQGDPELIFVGDSITDRWAHAGKSVWDRYYKPLEAVNMGVGGDGTQHVLWRLQSGELNGINPKLAVVMIGTNNSNGDDFTAEQIANGMIAVVSELRAQLPKTKILLLSIFPRGTYAQRKELPKPAEYSSQRAKNERASEIAAGLADGETVFYLNINDHLVDRDNRVSPEIFPDLVHPNAKGYEIWAEALAPMLHKILNEKHSCFDKVSTKTGIAGREPVKATSL
jgi:lysophospholipase L1-like esterase